MPLLSIIIPTHNRQSYAAHAVEFIARSCGDVEIIVSDTSAEDSLSALIQPLLSERVRYVRPGRAMSVVEHFEFAAGHAAGDYLMFLGDDDLVGPDVERIAAWAKRYSVDAVVSYRASFLAWYYWGGVQSKYYGDRYAERLFILPFTGRAWPLDRGAALAEVADNLGRGLGSMPRAYHGLVARGVVQKIRESHGALFGGVSPDIYSAVMISQAAKSAWIVDWPFVIPGGSPTSTAGTGAARSDQSSLARNPHTAAFTNLCWDRRVPAFYHPMTVWSHSMLQALDDAGLNEVRPNLARLYACCRLYTRGHMVEVRKAEQVFADQVGASKARRQIVAQGLREIAFQIRRLARRATNPGPGGEAHSIGNLTTIGAAYHALERIIEQRGLSPQLPEVPQR